MAAYMIVVDSEVHDREQADSLSLRIAELIEARGGKYLIRGTPTLSLGPGAPPASITVSEFETLEDLKAAFGQDDVIKLRLERRASVESVAFMVEGL
ncbi:DUF1330 domain-containing protein [Candidatus Poriferisodalis sp.]|uniref:DUF1330 domain-containing protein n=1 Tax=Candidatus Poriferisodalis sp. TaxID=3101277 RepID=UPI003B0150B5